MLWGLVMVWVRVLLGGAVLMLWAVGAAAGFPEWWRVSAGLDMTPHGTQPGLAWDIDPPDACEGCHRSYNVAEQSFMPYNAWSGSMMANATRDPLFWAALDVANHDVPGVGDYCLRCHTPSGWFGGRVFKTATPGVTVDGQNGCLLQGNYAAYDTKGNDYVGLSCQYCHRMMPQGPGGATTALGSARLWLDDATQCNTPDGGVYGGPCRRGPYNYAAESPLAPPHGWQASPFHASAQLCGSCHNVDAPETLAGPLNTLILADGTDTGQTFPVERTYTEWARSDFADVIFRDRLGDPMADLPALARGQSCQECHMRTSASPDARACVLNPAGSRSGELPVHEFVGGNTWVPKLLKALYFAGDSDRQAALDRTAAWAAELLGQRSASVQVALQPYSAGAGTLTAQVKVINLSGHKLPTGYSEGRRVWLNVQARDANGTLVFESGAYDAATAALTEDSQARVYEVLQGIWDAGSHSCKVLDGSGRKQFHFALNNCIAKDNRIPPLGFTGKDALDVRPVGATYAETAPGSGRLVNYDLASYAIAVPPGTPLPITVTATLRYQLASRDYIEFLQREASDHAFAAENDLCAGGPDRPFTVGPQGKSRGQFLYDLWNDPQFGKAPPETLATASASTTP